MIDAAWLALELQRRNLVTAAQLRAAQATGNADLCLTLLQQGAVVEDDLLRFLGLHFQTQYVTTEKLGQVQVPPELLERVPAALAQQLALVPIRFDAARGLLSVIASDPSDPQLVPALLRTTGATEVVTYVALAHAVEAARNKWYAGDTEAFARVAGAVERGYSRLLDIYDQRTIDFGSEGAGGEEDGDLELATIDAPVAEGSPGDPPVYGYEVDLGDGTVADAPEPPTLPPLGTARGAPAAVGKNEIAKPTTLLPLAAPPDDAAPRSADAVPSVTRATVAPGVLVPAPGAHLALPTAVEAAATAAPGAPAVPLARIAVTSAADRGAERDAWAETAASLVGLIELDAGWRQGHSLRVAQIARACAQTAGLGTRRAWETYLAALLHELGKPAEPHLTALALERSAEARSAAERVQGYPLHLLGRSKLPREVLLTLGALYERPDGRGVPGTLRGEQLPLPAALLAAVDCYCDLLRNPAAPGGPAADGASARLRLRQAAERGALSPRALDALEKTLAEQPTVAFAAAPPPSVLVVDPDAEGARVLQSRLVAGGFGAALATNTALAAREVLTHAFDLVICELEVEPVGGLDFLQRLRAEGRVHPLPMILVSRNSDPQLRQRALQAGAADFATKPFAFNGLVARARQVIATAAAKRDMTP